MSRWIGAAGGLSPVVAALVLVIAACGGAGHGGVGAEPGITFAPEPGVDLSSMDRTASGLWLETVRPGSGPTVERGQTVRVHYVGWLPDGTRFDSSRARGEPLEFPVGLGVVIDGWDEGVVGMRAGETRRLVVPPSLGYGQEGVPGVVPPGATLVFEVELLGVR